MGEEKQSKSQTEISEPLNIREERGLNMVFNPLLLKAGSLKQILIPVLGLDGIT